MAASLAYAMRYRSLRFTISKLERHTERDTHRQIETETEIKRQTEIHMHRETKTETEKIGAMPEE